MSIVMILIAVFFGNILVPHEVNPSPLPAVSRPSEFDLQPSIKPITYVDMTIYRNRIFIPVTINGGKEILFLVDNGCRNTYVDKKHLPDEVFLPEEEITHRALDRDNFQSVLGTIPILGLGNLEIENPRIALSDMPFVLSTHLRRSIGGIIGSEIIRPYLTTFDFTEGRVLFQPATEEIREIIRSQPGLIVLPFCNRVDASIKTHNIMVTITVNGVRVEAIVDLGYSGEILTSLDREKIGLPGEIGWGGTTVSVAGLNGEGYKNYGCQVKIGDFSVHDIEVTYFLCPKAPEFTLIGLGLLKQFTLTFDYQERVLYLLPR
jgi:hypothetical protein